MKDWLAFENTRNKEHSDLYVTLLRRACAAPCLGEHKSSDTTVVIGHHLMLEFNGDLTTENEIPSADTLLFDHDIMEAVFGDSAVCIMQSLAEVPAEDRDELLRQIMTGLGML